MRWITVVPRETLYDVAALALRLAVGGVFAHHAWWTIDGGAITAARLAEFGIPAAATVATILPHVELAFATAFALGMLTPLAGSALVTLGGAAVWLALTTTAPLAPGAAPALLMLVIAACLPPMAHTGGFSVDQLAFSRPPSSRHRMSARRSPRNPESSAKRPEHAPPLPYAEERAAVSRPPTRT